MPKVEPFEQYSDVYDQWFEKNFETYMAELKLLQGLIPFGHEARGLEVGVGSGKFAGPLRISIGVEPSAQMAVKSKMLGIRVVLGVAEDLPFPEARFDYLLSVTTICFVDDIEQTFSEAYRVLKPGGYHIVGFIDRESDLGKSYAASREKSRFYKEANFFSTPEIIVFLQKAEFFVEIIKQTIIPGTPQGTIRDGFGHGAFVGIKAVK